MGVEGKSIDVENIENLNNEEWIIILFWSQLATPCF